MRYSFATGTGSGKTECFLLPILAHCLQMQKEAQRGVKAILIYPMNALATDQATRIAKMIHGNDKLRGKVGAGLYIGEDKGKRAKRQTSMAPTCVITDRAAMQDAPPDILLTNYKMLDYLLLRPDDQPLWQNNGVGTLRFLVVDEIHTFDGPQGTDLACLIRRLKRRLQVDDGSLCCIGTSATLGSDTASEALIKYAGDVFGEHLVGNAVIAESRQSAEEYLGEFADNETTEPDLDGLELLDPTYALNPTKWLREVATQFIDVKGSHRNNGLPEDDGDFALWLGERLPHHALFHSLLRLIGAQTLALDTIVKRLSRERRQWREHPDFGAMVVTSILALISAARLPVRRATGDSTRPLLDVRVQLWQRELTRMVGSLHPERPQL